MLKVTEKQLASLERLATIIAPYKAKNLTGVLVKEVEDEDYLNQGNFKDSLTPCLDRGIAILKEAGVEITPDKAVMMQYIIAVHRNNAHNEETQVELNMSMSMLAADQEETLIAFGWWQG